MKNLASGVLHYASFRYKNFLGIKHTVIPYYILQKVKKDSIIIDCGANIGNVSAPLIQLGAKLFCFEPHPLAFETLIRRFANEPNVKVFNFAVGTYNHTAKLYKHMDSDLDEIHYSTGSSLIAAKTNININDYFEIQVIDLLDFINYLNSQIFLIKIDIEGAEVELIHKFIDEGTYKVIDYIFVETHEEQIPELAIPIKDLKSRIRQLKIKNIYTNWT